MNLGDLLQELRENILHDRSDQVAGTASDQLWSDKTLVRYINEAQRRFARDSLIIQDATTPSVVNVEMVAEQNDYALHPSILSVLSARYVGDAGDLGRTGHSALSAYRPANTLFFDPSRYNSLPNGKPLAFSTDEGLALDDVGASSVVTLHLYPAPTAAYLAGLKLRVIRLPLDDFSVEDLSAFPEIPETHHLEMLDWAAYLALRIRDLDAGDDAAADKFRASFEDHVKKAREVVMRKLFAPIGWQFGRAGFSWER